MVNAHAHLNSGTRGTVVIERSETNSVLRGVTED